MFRFQSRSFYAGEGFRPRLQIHASDTSNLILVSSHWSGEFDPGQALQAIEGHLTSAKDLEQTQLHETTSERLDPIGHLKDSLLSLSQSLYEEHNSRETTTLIEALVLFQDGEQVVWAAVGQPHLLLRRGAQFHIAHTGADHSALANGLPPLASQGLGLTDKTIVNAGSFQKKSVDQVVLLASPRLVPFESFDSLETGVSEFATRFSDLSFCLAVSDPLISE